MVVLTMQSEVRTRDGFNARILCVDLKSTKPVLAIVQYKQFKNNSGNLDEYYYQFYIDGSSEPGDTETDIDLVLVESHKPDYTTIRCKFAGSLRKYTYLNHDLTIKRGDLAVVKNNKTGEYSIVQVVGVDETPQIPKFTLTWIVCKVDLAQYNMRMMSQQEVITDMRED